MDGFGSRDIDIVETVPAQDVAANAREWIVPGDGFVLVVPEPVLRRRRSRQTRHVVDVASRSQVDSDGAKGCAAVGQDGTAGISSKRLRESDVAEAGFSLGSVDTGGIAGGNARGVACCSRDISQHICRSHVVAILDWIVCLAAVVLIEDVEHVATQQAPQNSVLVLVPGFGVGQLNAPKVWVGIAIYAALAFIRIERILSEGRSLSALTGNREVGGIGNRAAIGVAGRTCEAMEVPYRERGLQGVVEGECCVGVGLHLIIVAVWPPISDAPA